MKPLVLSPDDVNADWLKVLTDKDGRTYRETELELHDALLPSLKHLPGRHDQKTHTPKAYVGGQGTGPAGLAPSKERQERFYQILSDDSLNSFQRNEAIRGEIEQLPAGKEVLDQLRMWYYNPGNPEEALGDIGDNPEAADAWDEYQSLVDSGEMDEDTQFEDWVYDRADAMGYVEGGDAELNDAMEAVRDGIASPEQVEAMSAVYDYTQAYMRKNVWGEPLLHRGMALDSYEADQLQPGNSVHISTLGHWSENESTPAKFAMQNLGEDPDRREVILHKKFKRDEIFDHYTARATKFDQAFQLEYEQEIVPIATQPSYRILDVIKKKSDWTGEEVLHVWLE